LFGEAERRTPKLCGRGPTKEGSIITRQEKERIRKNGERRVHYTCGEGTDPSKVEPCSTARFAKKNTLLRHINVIRKGRKGRESYMGTR